MDTASRIKIIRILNGYTQEAIAALLGAPRPSIVVWESGKHPPAQLYVMKLADLVGVEPGYILFGRPPVSYSAWIPSPPGRPQNLSPYLRDISSMFPLFLDENELNSVRYCRLGDGGTMYLLGRNNFFSNLLLVREPLVGCFGKILETTESVEMMAFENVTVDTFGENELKVYHQHARGNFKIDYKGMCKSLFKIRTGKYELSSIATEFFYALQQFDPLEIEDLVKYGVFFEKTANNNVPLKDVNPFSISKEAEDYLISIGGQKKKEVKN